MSEPLHHPLERNARKFRDEIAVRHPEQDVTLSWHELNGLANALAHCLIDKGVRKGDHVALIIPNHPDFITAFYAASKVGAVVVPINVRLTPSEMRYILTNSDSCACIFHEALRPAAEQAITPDVRFRLSTAEIGALRDRYSQENPAIEVSTEDISEIIYTSGTTGRPKGAVLTHGAAYLGGAMIAYEGDIRHRDRVLHLMPLTHSGPLNLFMIGATYAGAMHVTGTFTPQAILELTAREKITHFFGAPVAFLLAARLPDFAKYDLSSVKRWIYGGAPLSRQAVLMLMEKFGSKLMCVYGITEAGPNGIGLYPEEHPRFAGSIGRRSTVTCEIILVDDQGREVATGEPGEMWIKGPTVMRGYYKNEQATKESFAGDWFKTGDIARRDGDGYLWILDRKKDMIISGGVNVYPKEIEDVLIAHPAVADVAVIGVPHPEWGETVLAVIVPKGEARPTVEEIRSFCGAQLAEFKLPRQVDYVEMIPRNPSGKILKEELKKRYLDRTR